MAGMPNTLNELFADRGVVLGSTDNAVVFIHGKTLVGNRLLHRVVRLIGKALLVGYRRLRDLALITLPNGGHLTDGSGSSIQLHVRNDRRW